MDPSSKNFTKNCKGTRVSLERETSEFLGIPITTDYRLLLGITRGRNDRIAIYNALRRRLAQLHVHPNGFTDEANKVRVFLQQIASELEKSAPKEPTQSNQAHPELTPLDQSLIAALISEGGWNKNSRSRLVGVAASYSITVGGLVRILEAFAEAARNGSGPLSLQQRSTHTIDRSWTSMPTKPSAFSAVDHFITDAAKRFTPELSSPSPIMTIKLAILFSLLTIMAFILALRVLLVDESTSTINQQTIKSSFPSTTPNVSIQKQLAVFETYPTFSVDGIEESMLQYADQGAEQPSKLASIANTIQTALTKGEQPPKQLLQDWNNSIDVLAYGWPFINSQLLHASEVQIVHVLLQAELYPSFAKQLLESFQSPSLSMGAPSQIARITWDAGILATLSYEHRLNAETRNLVKRMQYASITNTDSSKAKTLALNHIADVLLKRTEFDNRSLEMWEAWFVVAKQLQKFSKSSNHQVYLINTILNSTIDLLRESNTRRVLGRAVSDANWLSSSSARDEICDIIRFAESSTIDLAVLTTLFNQAERSTWFTEQYLINHDNNLEERIAIANQLQNDWPLDTSELIMVWNLSIPTGLDVELVQDWENAITSASRLSDDDLLRFAKLRILNEAAVSIWKGRPDLATRAIEMSARIELDTSEQFHQTVVNTDGSFSKRFHDAGKDQYDQIDAIDTLLNSEATDLGNRDADLLASIALTNRKSKVRIAATKAITEQFKNGPNLAIAIVQYISKAKTKEQISSLVANLTNAILPDQHSLHWQSAARKALIQHAITAGNQQQWELDEISNDISTSLIAEYLMLNPSALPLSQEVQPLSALEMIVDSWRRILPPSYVQINEIHFSPTGILQQYLLKQIEYLSLLKAEEARWRSQQHPVDNIHLVLEKLHQKETILEQINTVELEMSLHWLRLLEEVLTENERRYNN